MNKERRKRLAVIREATDALRTELETLKDEDGEALEAMPDGLRGSSRGEAAEEAFSNLEAAVSSLEDAVNYMEEAGQ